MTRTDRHFLRFAVIGVALTSLAALVPLSAQTALTFRLVGDWVMEDAYTIQAPPDEGLRIESHPEGMFAFDLSLAANGTGFLDGQRFAWSVDERDGSMLWRFQTGATVRMLPRFISDDLVLVLAVSPQGGGPVGAVSVLSRRVAASD